MWESEKIEGLEDELQVVMDRMETEGIFEDLRKNWQQVVNQLWKEYRLQEIMWLQKARIRWLKIGYRNSQYFHKVCKVRDFEENMANLSFDGEIL